MKCEVSTTDATNRARHAELHDGPIVAGAAPAASLPAVAHVFAEAGHQEIQGHAKKLVARLEDSCAVYNAGEVDLGTRDLLPIRNDFAMDAQTGYAAVRIDFQAEMRDAAGVLDCELILRIACERRFRQQFGPFRCGRA